jgi:hypothetical protein
MVIFASAFPQNTPLILWVEGTHEHAIILCKRGWRIACNADMGSKENRKLAIVPL